MPIRILEEHVVNQIAAGEVVERPASVVKELLENSLDAGATQIDIALRDGGRALIRVSDNGIGMNNTDAMMCFERHATSKIRRAEDLSQVTTLGFRGEALPSIAAVSRFQLLTRPADEEVGTKVKIEGGTLLSCVDAGCAAGTQIDVRSLFYNLPARRKFMRTRGTEQSHCVEMVVREGLARPEVDFTLTQDGRELLRALGGVDPVTRARDLLGRHGRSLVAARFNLGDLTVEGLVSPVGIHRSTAVGAMYLYVNGRYVRDPVVRRAVYEAYRDLVPRGRYPVVVLDIRLPPADVDVNVHPTKIEVRFQNPRGVGHAIATGLREVLSAQGVSREALVSEPLTDAPLFVPNTEPLPFRPPRNIPSPIYLEKALPRPHPDDDDRWREPPATPLLATEPSIEAERDIETERGIEGAPRYGDLVVIGLLADRWALCEDDGELVVIDPVAGREQLAFASLQASPAEALGQRQRLLAPRRIEMPVARADRIAAVTEPLEDLGIALDRFAPNAWAVRTLPLALVDVDVDALLTDVAAASPSGLYAAIAAHVASAEESALDVYEVRTLLASLDDAGQPVSSPTALRIPPRELIERFRRSRGS